MKQILPAKISKNNSQRHKISVIISGMPSVGKTTAANMIARKFRLKQIAGGDMLREIAIARGYDPKGADWWDSKEGMTFLAERKTNHDFDNEVDRKLIEYVKKGGVVITSYTVPWLCSEGLKIWFAASPRVRAKRLAGRDRIAEEKAIKIIRQRDRKNKSIYSRIYNIGYGKDLSVFNYIIETDDMSASEVAKAASGLVKNYKMSTNS